MTQAEALEIIEAIQKDLGLLMLETLMHLQDNPDEMAGFRALLAPA